MITQQQKVLIQNLVDSDVFEELVLDIKKDIFNDWQTRNDRLGRDALYYESQALDRLVDNLRDRAREINSGDTNA